MSLTIESTQGGGVRVLQHGSVAAVIDIPIRARGLGGIDVRRGYTRATGNDTGLVGMAEWAHEGASMTVDDVWAVESVTRVTLRRTVASTGESASGVQLALNLALPNVGGRHYFLPGMIYSADQWADGATHSYSDSRLAYPIVASLASGSVTTLLRIDTADTDEAPRRLAGDSEFIHRTKIGAVGFRENKLVASWPYFEGDHSAMFDAKGTRAAAFYPLDEPLDVSLLYAIEVHPAADRADALRVTFDQAIDMARPEPANVGLDLSDSIDLRLDSAAKTFRRSIDGFAGFVLNFDPERGYDSDPKAFGASFAEHSMDGTHDILEYGFTGRQLNIAYMLAKRAPGEWRERAAAVVDSFVSRMSTPSGWVHTLWDLAKSEPVFACGDPRGLVMHYLGASDVAGSYTRMMAEAGRDLLLNIRLHRDLGTDTTGWLACAEALGRFFVHAQESDGSWFRAYTPSGEPIVDSEWFGYRAGSGKTATATVIPFLAALSAMGESDAAAYLEAAQRAGDYVQAAAVDVDEYRGGTLDNPNVVDKEAAFIVMQAMLSLYDAAQTSDDNVGEAAKRLEAARRAAGFAITWHSIWTVPPIEGTALARAGVNSVGWGGINSVWGVGVTDIYSLFFIADLVRLSQLADDPLFARIAELVACSSVELLAVSGDLHGFADTGMQPEGISFCSQGEDDGLIRKGDTWGGLGWPYTAGSYGLETYLRERDRTAGRPADAQQCIANHSQRRK